jgi:hypothetical protein
MTHEEPTNTKVTKATKVTNLFFSEQESRGSEMKTTAWWRSPLWTVP